MGNYGNAKCVVQKYFFLSKVFLYLAISKKLFIFFLQLNIFCNLIYSLRQLVFSSHGLLTTVGYKMGADAPVIYALEGSIAVAGVAIRWLRDNLQILKEVKDAKPLAENSHPPGDVVFVPAFSGLYAPYWRQDARRLVNCFFIFL